MLGIGCPDRHAFLFIRSLPPPKTRRPRRAPPPARAGSFYGANRNRPSATPSSRSPPLSGPSAVVARTGLHAPKLPFLTAAKIGSVGWKASLRIALIDHLVGA